MSDPSDGLADQGDGEPPAEGATSSTAEIVEALLARSRLRARPAPVQSMNDEQRAKVAAINERTSIRKLYGRGAGAVVVLQIGVVDWIFYRYLDGNGWDVPSGVMVAWLSATVVQAIGVVLVITKSIFENDGT